MVHKWICRELLPSKCKICAGVEGVSIPLDSSENDNAIHISGLEMVHINGNLSFVNHKGHVKA